VGCRVRWWDDASFWIWMRVHGCLVRRAWITGDIHPSSESSNKQQKANPGLHATYCPEPRNSLNDSICILSSRLMDICGLGPLLAPP